MSDDPVTGPRAPRRTRVVLGEAAATGRVPARRAPEAREHEDPARPDEAPAQQTGLPHEESAQHKGRPHEEPAQRRARASEERARGGAGADLAELTPVGEALVKGLVRAQLALAVRLSLVVAAGLGALPLLFAVAPAVGRTKVLGVHLPWLLLGFAAFPFLVVVGWAYVRWAERNEQDFIAVIRRPES